MLISYNIDQWSPTTLASIDKRIFYHAVTVFRSYIVKLSTTTRRQH